MKESYSEGVAHHTGPESCAGIRKGVGEALTGGGAGRASSRETLLNRGADVLGRVWKATPDWPRSARPVWPGRQGPVSQLGCLARSRCLLQQVIRLLRCIICYREKAICYARVKLSRMALWPEFDTNRLLSGDSEKLQIDKSSP